MAQTHVRRGVLSTLVSAAIFNPRCLRNRFRGLCRRRRRYVRSVGGSNIDQLVKTLQAAALAKQCLRDNAATAAAVVGWGFTAMQAEIQNNKATLVWVPSLRQTFHLTPL